MSLLPANGHHSDFIFVMRVGRFSAERSELVDSSCWTNLTPQHFEVYTLALIYQFRLEGISVNKISASFFIQMQFPITFARSCMNRIALFRKQFHFQIFYAFHFISEYFFSSIWIPMNVPYDTSLTNPTLFYCFAWYVTRKYLICLTYVHSDCLRNKCVYFSRIFNIPQSKRA